MASERVFREYNFVLNPRQGQLMRSRVMEFLQPNKKEPNGTRILTEYFDTPDRDIYWEWQFGTEKRMGIRIRVVSQPGSTKPPAAFLDIKHRVNGMCTRRKLPVRVTDLEVIRSGNLSTCGYRRLPMIWSEFERILQAREQEPTIQICYKRYSVYSNPIENMRITFDSDVYCRLPHQPLLYNEAAFNQPILAPGWCVMKAKTVSSLPDWLHRLLAEYALVHRGFSKYEAAIDLQERLHCDYLQRLPAKHPEKPAQKRLGQQEFTLI